MSLIPNAKSTMFEKLYAEMPQWKACCWSLRPTLVADRWRGLFQVTVLEEALREKILQSIKKNNS